MHLRIALVLSLSISPRALAVDVCVDGTGVVISQGVPIATCTISTCPGGTGQCVESLVIIDPDFWVVSCTCQGVAFTADDWIAHAARQCFAYVQVEVIHGVPVETTQCTFGFTECTQDEVCEIFWTQDPVLSAKCACN
jgi:hypothetical protein